MRHPADVFAETVGKIGEPYEEEEWHCRLGFFASGWVEAMKEARAVRVLVIVSYEDSSQGQASGVVALPDDCVTEEQMGQVFGRWLVKRHPHLADLPLDVVISDAEYAWNEYEVEVPVEPG